MEKLNYDDYVKECLSLNAAPMSESEYNGGPTLRLVPPAMVGNAGRFVINTATNTAQRMLNGESPTSAAANAMREEGQRVLTNVRQTQTTRLSLTSGKSQIVGEAMGGDSKSTLPPIDSPPSGPGYKLLGQFTPNPLEISLQTGINPRIYADTMNEPSSAACFNHLTGLRFGFLNASTYLLNYVNNIMIPYLQNKVQMSVSFSVNVALINQTNLLNYLDLIAKSLQTYYFYTRILSYTSIPTNPDRGMFALRQMISASDIDLLTQLKQQLQSYPIPPNLNKLCFWLMQGYTDGSNSQTVLGFIPISFTGVSNDDKVSSFDSTAISSLVTALSSANSSGLVPLLSRVLPNWVLEDVYDASPVLVYDENWLNVWANAPYTTYYNNAQNWGPIVTNDTEYFNAFAVFNDEPDGLSIGLQNVGIGTGASLSAQVWSNNLMNIISSGFTYSTGTFYSNRYSYTKPSNANPVWRLSSPQIEAAFGRPETKKYYNGNTFFSRVPNTIVPVNMNALTANYIGRDIVTWSLSLDTIKDKPEKKYYDSTKPKGK